MCYSYTERADASIIQTLPKRFLSVILLPHQSVCRVHQLIPRLGRLDDVRLDGELRWRGRIVWGRRRWGVRVDDARRDLLRDLGEEEAVVVLDRVLEVLGPLCARVLFLLRHGLAVDEEVRPGREVQAGGIGEDGLLGYLEHTSVRVD